ncbi:MAG: hypothetical protein IRY91_16355 [Gemmatimonadaceae bacterium]|nr:hypothetical protein [Gemmatimonadaceae bacterium]
MTSDGRERFLKAIAERIDPERIAEVHLFPPIRQGGRETGVAVVTVLPAEERGAEATADAAAADGVAEEVAMEDAATDHAEDIDDASAGDASAAGDAPQAEHAVEAGSVEGPAGGAADASIASAGDDGDRTGETESVPSIDAADLMDIVSSDVAEAAPPVRPPVRLTVYRASYRLTLKGPDRGKWEVTITEEADAPPPAVDAVVRGVHLRAGGDDEPERLTGEAFRAALVTEPWATR